MSTRSGSLLPSGSITGTGSLFFSGRGFASTYVSSRIYRMQGLSSVTGMTHYWDSPYSDLSGTNAPATGSWTQVVVSAIKYR